MSNGGLIRILYNDEVVKLEILKKKLFLGNGKEGFGMSFGLYHTIFYVIFFKF